MPKERGQGQAGVPDCPGAPCLSGTEQSVPSKEVSKEITLGRGGQRTGGDLGRGVQEGLPGGGEPWGNLEGEHFRPRVLCVYELKGECGVGGC